MFGMQRSIRPLTMTTARRWCSTGLDFNDPASAYKPKSNWEIARTILVFQLCAQPWLVKNSEWLLNVSKRVIGETATHGIVKASFFAHFCAGENELDMQPTLKKLESVGVGAILDYAAEKDVKEDDASDQRQGVVESGDPPREYVNEAECDANVELILSCIDTASRTPTDGIAAVKLTGLGKPDMLVRISKILLGVRKIWIAAFTREPTESIPEEELRHLVSRPDLNPLIPLDVFRASLRRAGVDMSDAEVDQVFEFLDRSGDGLLDYLEWTGLLSLDSFSDVALEDEKQRLVQKMVMQLAAKYGVQCLSPQEHELSKNLVERLRTISATARDCQVRLLIDAEQTYMQVAIDHFALKMQREYNQQFPTIFNTYQCYLDFARNRLDNDLERSQREGWVFAAKLVRGAYMNQERRLSAEKCYRSPINPSIEETHATYNYCVQKCLENIGRSEVVIATHNQESIELAVRLMKERNIDPRSHGVYFAQLLGMADHLSLTLGQGGYKAFKYVPYGPVGYCLPYLIRRAQENADVMAGAQKEMLMLWQELKRRKFVLSA